MGVGDGPNLPDNQDPDLEAGLDPELSSSQGASGIEPPVLAPGGPGVTSLATTLTCQETGASEDNSLCEKCSPVRIQRADLETRSMAKGDL